GTVTAITAAAVTTVGTTATINNTGAYWNANQLQSRDVASTAPTDGQVLAWDNANSHWEPSGNTYQATIVEIYDAAGTQNLSASFADITFGTTNINDAGYTIGGSGSQITITTAGTYRITYRVTAIVTNNTGTGGEFRLTQNGTEVPGTLGYTFHQNSSRNKGTVTVVKLLTLSANDIIRVEGRKYTGGNLSLVANGSSLIIERIR
ncbi:MAG: dentin sialophosphoprotein, partial [Bacteroidetes bacterium]|nr:dentin sialophosphoprotein [Bacteroidota bacterium]